ncbi:MAG: sugar ABC transporter permease [Oscillospiraceae bacterium]|nr:sugar ABC transporter permease [Oscillospiraceae bacterium]
MSDKDNNKTEAPEQLEEIQAKATETVSKSSSDGKQQTVKLEKVEKNRAAYRAKKLKKHEADTAKQFALIDKAEAREKAKTSDPTQQREIELLAEKKREELKASSAQRGRVIASSTGSRLSYERKKSLYGYGFISIWIIGVILIFVGPLVQSVQYSLSNTTLVSMDTMAEYGMSEPGIHLRWNDFRNYRHALTVDPDFTVDLATSLGALGPQIAMVLIFSLFVAVLLNQKFKGRTLMRAIFFFPVLIATGPVISVINGTMASQGAAGDAAQFSTMFQADMVDGFMRFLGLYNINEEFTTFIGTVTSDIFNLLWKSGIQILIFLSALQQIPTAAKEAASMEGATAWEFFWKITFPTISPMILANLIYTIIDTFSDSQNIVMRLVLRQVSQNQFGLGAAMAWIYFGIIALALAVVVGIVSRFVFYQVD